MGVGVVDTAERTPMTRLLWDERFGLEEHETERYEKIYTQDSSVLVRKSLIPGRVDTRVTTNLGDFAPQLVDNERLMHAGCANDRLDRTIEYRTLKPRSGDIIEVASRNEMQRGQRPATPGRAPSRGWRQRLSTLAVGKVNAISNWFRRLTHLESAR